MTADLADWTCPGQTSIPLPATGPHIGSLCTGYGGLDAAAQQVFGGELAWVADIDPGAAAILAHHHPAVPNLGDLTTTDWAAVPPVDVLTAGYPCQPFSLAGNLKGTADDRHLWPHIAAALRVLRPRVIVLENVANHLRLGFDTVLADLADLGCDAEWMVVRASDVGAPHGRRRLFVLAWPADADRPGLEGRGLRGAVAERGGAAADAADLGHQRPGSARGRRPGPADHGDAAAHAGRVVRGDDGELPAGRHALRQRVRDDAPRCGAAPATNADSGGRRPGEHDVPAGQPDASWGRFAPAVHRWANVLGRPAPWATDALGRLNPPFVEWLMGLPAGHVTDVPGLTRNQMLHALGNGVVPQQAAAALRLLAGRAGFTTARVGAAA